MWWEAVGTFSFSFSGSDAGSGAGRVFGWIRGRPVSSTSGLPSFSPIATALLPYQNEYEKGVRYSQLHREQDYQYRNYGTGLASA